MKKVERRQLTKRRRAGRKVQRRSAEKDVDKRPRANKWVSIGFIFATLAFSRLLTLPLLFSLWDFYDAEQISKRSVEGEVGERLELAMVAVADNELEQEQEGAQEDLATLARWPKRWTIPY